MAKYTQVEFIDIQENDGYISLIESVADTCFVEENLQNINMYLNVILTNGENIKKANNTYRKIDKETDVLSFPMFEKEELEVIKEKSQKEKIEIQEVLGDIIISIEQVEKQADEYEHSEKRELAYMIVHGFYHIIGYDHMNEEEKTQMRNKEEIILNKLNIKRN